MLTFKDAFSKAERGEEIGPADAAVLLKTQDDLEAEALFALADSIREELVGNEATYVVNRNMNFSNICVGSCRFCGFSRRKGQQGSYFFSHEAMKPKLEEAKVFGVTEICIQGGLHPDLTFDYYLDLLRFVRKIIPGVHLHAYSPEEINYMTKISGLEVSDVVKELRAAGLGSTPGTAAEVLVERVRKVICPDKLHTGRWVDVITEVHRQGIPSTSTIMFGHVETPEDVGEHLEVIRSIQKKTGRITEFVPLPFIPYENSLGSLFKIQEMISNREVFKLYAVSRIYFRDTIRNLQSAWPKIGLKAGGHALRVGVNDVGGTLMEERISNMAGSKWGDRVSVDELRETILQNGRTPVQRDTLYNKLN